MELDYIFEENRIYAVDKGDKILAQISFHDKGNDTMEIDHTYVEDSHRGQGIAGDLMEMAVDTIGRRGKKITASCSYAAKWLEKHPQNETQTR